MSVMKMIVIEYDEEKAKKNMRRGDIISMALFTYTSGAKQLVTTTWNCMISF